MSPAHDGEWQVSLAACPELQERSLNQSRYDSEILQSSALPHHNGWFNMV